LALFAASLNAIDPAILNASSDESTSWYDPSYSSTATSSTALIDRLDVLLRDGAADDAVDELVALTRLARDEPDPGVSVLASTTGLADIAPLALGQSRQRFLVGDLRTADARLDTKFPLQAVDDDLEVELAHARDDDLAGLIVGFHAERGILRHQLSESEAELFLIRFGLRFDRQRDHRLGEIHRLQHDRVLLVADGVAGGHAS